ncbi:cytochrome c biogenesis protein CcsA [Verrucomicrobium sp. BvORR106]|uniref:cytochrome c biogenesis protein n=1 Tax=Verrucomicrobium sp. BvORR106 TaxID=1403819 RepID=UPI0005714CEE|nr:cytochrome c biogenesis protein CcsA [Verrucomicrobium sp. BvORR106]
MIVRSFLSLFLAAVVPATALVAQDAAPAAPVPAPAEKVQPPAPPQMPDLATVLDPEVISLLAGLPAQESGRIKPLDTIARFRLLRFSGRQSIPVTEDAKSSGKALTDPVTGKELLNAKGKPYGLSATEWLALTWFRPDIAKDLRVFIVDNSDAIIEIGVKAKNKRDRYSYNELVSGRSSLMKKMQEIREVDSKNRNPVQRALGKLAMDFLDYEMIMGHFDFARDPFGGLAASVPADILAAGESGKVSAAVLVPKIQAYLQAHPEAAAPMNNPWLREYFRAVLGALMSGNSETVLRIFPPDDNKVEIWYGPGSVLQTAIEGGTAKADELKLLAEYENIYRNRMDVAKFKTSLESFHNHVVRSAAERGESGHIAMELKYHQKDYFYYALILFVAGTIALALSWVAPEALWGKIVRVLCWLVMLAGAAYGTMGIVVRCLIMERPPITTLYETILFITISSVLLGLLMEAVGRRAKGLGLAVACLAGMSGLFLSLRFMEMDGADTLQELQAVLITNFWLSTHVPCINLGYAAGMVAAIFSMIYFVMRLFGIAKHKDETSKDISRMAYAFVMAGLFLSLVGTVLGGIWANYSWGRFWGWDPKENGALMIVLMNLIILHARLGGYIREVGFHASNIVLGMIVAFSWFGTNQLGVGLHAYGFTDGVWTWLYRFWALQSAFLVYAVILHFLDKSSDKREEGAALPTEMVKGS